MFSWQNTQWRLPISFLERFQLLTLSSSLFLLESFVPAFLEQWLNSVSSASILYSNSKGPQQCCQSRQQFSLHWNCEIVNCLVSPGPLVILRQSPSAVVNGCFGPLDHDLLELSTQFTIAAVNGRHLPCSEFSRIDLRLILWFVFRIRMVCVLGCQHPPVFFLR